MSDYADLFLRTDPINKLKARVAVEEMYRLCGLPEPTIQYIDGPLHLAQAIEDLGDLAEPLYFDDHNTIATFHTSRGWGKGNRLERVVSDAYSKSELPRKRFRSNLFLPVSYLLREKGDESYTWPWQVAACDIWKSTYGVVTYKGMCFILDTPKEVYHNDRGFHDTSGAAMVFRDGTKAYAYEGEVVPANLIADKKAVTLNDLHQGNSRRHTLIALYGIENYLELVKDFKIDVKGRFQSFFGFHHVDEPDKLPGMREFESTMGKSYREWYAEKPYTVTIDRMTVNANQWSMVMFEEHKLFVSHKRDILQDKASRVILPTKEDRQLWRHLKVDDMMSRGAHKLHVSFLAGELSLKSHKYPDSRHPNCHRDVCPSWVKAHMLLGTSCEYEDDVAHVRVTDGKFQLLRGPKECRQDSLFDGCNAVPSYSFDVDIRSETWVGLLEKWADLSFKWLHMCEDSRCMP